MFTPLTAAHRADYLRFAKAFYCSDAVEHPIPLSHMERTFDALAAGSPYLAGFLLTHQGAPAGYALLMKTWSQEAGGLTVWADELYVDPAFRGHGLGGAFLKALPALFPDAAAFRLELEPDNTGARALYARLGFQPLGYAQMIFSQKSPLDGEDPL